MHSGTHKNEDNRVEWVLRSAAVVLGLLLIYTGREAIGRGIFWVMGYNARTGTIGTGPTLGLIHFGVALIIVGLLPRKTIARVAERRFLPNLRSGIVM
jgi:hypothetical protein